MFLFVRWWESSGTPRAGSYGQNNSPFSERIKTKLKQQSQSNLKENEGNFCVRGSRINLLTMTTLDLRYYCEENFLQLKNYKSR